MSYNWDVIYHISYTAQKMKFSVMDLPNPQFPEDLVTFTEEILNGKLHFLCSDISYIRCHMSYIIGIKNIKILLQKSYIIACINEMKDVFKGAAITAQKMKFSIKDFFSTCDQIRSFLRIWPHLLKKSLMQNFIFCIVLRSIHV